MRIRSAWCHWKVLFAGTDELNGFLRLPCWYYVGEELYFFSPCVVQERRKKQVSQTSGFSSILSSSLDAHSHAELEGAVEEGRRSTNVQLSNLAAPPGNGSQFRLHWQSVLVSEIRLQTPYGKAPSARISSWLPSSCQTQEWLGCPWQFLNCEFRGPRYARRSLWWGTTWACVLDLLWLWF